MTNNIDIHYWLAQFSNKLKRKILVDFLMLTSVVWVLFFYITLSILNFSTISIIGVLIAYIVFVLLFTKTQGYRQITEKNVLEHLNRQFPQLEESAQLLVADNKKHPLLIQLQQQKIKSVFTLLLTDKNNQQKALGKYHHKTYLIAALLILIACVIFKPLAQFNQFIDTSHLTTPNSTLEKVISPATLMSQKVTVEPPLYTKLTKFDIDKMDIKAIIGSNISWRLGFSQPTLSYSLVFSNGDEIDLALEDNYFIASKNITNTGLYQIKAGAKLLPKIYTIEVINDQRPTIRILTPKLTITEISSDTAPKIETRVQVSDDFGLTKVDILASIAKGSGEAVKFRDQVFEFDQVKQKNVTLQDKTFVNINEYQKSWNLADLGMEPGDELYFTVSAWDNQSPEPQQTKSITKIIRWLEDNEQAMMADGVLINFMPEYFKSQRQIIIETKQLIADSNLLTKAELTKTSELLGIAQSELKQKYGQYLGDEFEDASSEGVSAKSSELKTGDEHDEDHDEDHSSDKDHADDSSHVNEHQHESTQSNGANEGVQSAYESVLAEYAHTHEDSDIGLMGKQDPVALMKRSVANMWEAELYLMLSKPEQALPYEEQALKFLKMAKKAERIYVKRLGFEPPPVSEKRRYQGELDEIISLSQSQLINIPVSDYQKLNQAFILLSQNILSNKELDNELKTDQRQLLIQVKELFGQQIKVRPALIEFVAIIEQILLANNLAPINCKDCIVKLRNKIWQIMPMPNAIISTSAKNTNISEKLTLNYINKINVMSEPVSQVTNELTKDISKDLTNELSNESKNEAQGVQ